MKTLVLGGARSGKSHYAEQQAQQSAKKVIYIATAQALDEEMQQRIAHHQQQRPSHWQLVEEPLQLVQALQQHAAADSCLLVDCLTLWISNYLCDETRAATFPGQIDDLLQLLPQLPGDIIFVSNEISMGIVPMGKLNREFVDTAGRLHQRLAAVCDSVTLMVAGIPNRIKG